jgi:hypothetical protein
LKPTTEFVLLAEAGILEWQALLLVESIRQVFRPEEATITVASPRPDRRPGGATILELGRLGACYRPLTIQSPCPYYGTSFKLLTMAEIERGPGPEQLVMLDSDTLFLSRPFLDSGGNGVALRPVDVKGMCTSGIGDPFDVYWRELCTICEVDYDEIPWIESAVDRKQIKASHNGGLVAVNRNHGLFVRSSDFLVRSLDASLYPRTQDGQPFKIGAGVASAQAARLWGAAQAVLSLAIVSLGLQAKVLGPTYNVPLHCFDSLLLQFPEIARVSVHVHYHWLCEADQIAANPMLDGRMAIPAKIDALLRSRLPIKRARETACCAK